MRLGDVSELFLGPTMMGRNMMDFLEEAVPGLGSAQGEKLFLDDLPYLRSIWLTAPGERPWARHMSLDEDRVPGFVSDSLLAHAEDETVPADLAAVVYTSGSSALPKGVVHTQGSIIRTTASFGAMRSGDNDVVFCVFPFFWIGGFLVLGGALAAGLTVCCLERFEAQAGARHG